MFSCLSNLVISSHATYVSLKEKRQIFKFHVLNTYYNKVMSTRDNEEFKNALRDIACHSHKLKNPFDRVRCCEWVRKLASLPDDNLETSKMRNDYAQFLRIQVCNNVLHAPFLHPPEEHHPEMIPLPERLGRLQAEEIPYLPKVGPIAPVVHHRSPDGRAYVSVKQIPGGGVLCYLAVSPDGLP